MTAPHTKQDSKQETNEGVRLDKWLWAARFYKTRSAAATAITGGKVEVNGEQPKRAKALKIGDQIRVRKGPYTWELTVKSLSERRGPPAEAQKLFEESPESVEARKLLAEQMALERSVTPEPVIKGRPTKKDRRALSRLKGERY